MHAASDQDLHPLQFCFRFDGHEHSFQDVQRAPAFVIWAWYIWHCTTHAMLALLCSLLRALQLWAPDAPSPEQHPRRGQVKRRLARQLLRRVRSPPPPLVLVAHQVFEAQC